MKRLLLMFVNIMVFSLIGCGSNDSMDIDSPTKKLIQESTLITDDIIGITESESIKSDSKLENEIGVRGGFLLVHGDWIYYSTGHSLYKIKTDGTENQELYSTEYTPIANLTLIDEWLYFSVDGVHKVKLDGSEHQHLSSERTHGFMAITNDWIYFGRGRIKHDGTNEQIISDRNLLNHAIVDGWIYFRSSDGIIKMKTDGSENQLMYAADSINHNMYVINNWIYYSVGNNLYRIRTDGTDNQLFLIKESKSSWNIADNWFYSTSFTDNGTSIWKMKLDGTDKHTIITDIEKYGFIEIYYDWIYYTSSYFDENNNRIWSMHRIKNDGTDMQLIIKLIL